MSPVTDDPSDPRLTHGVDDGTPGPQNELYLVLPEDERAKGFVRPLRRSYTHAVCRVSTRMGLALCETYARDPKFYGATYCVGCQQHCRVDEFTWDEDGMVVGS